MAYRTIKDIGTNVVANGIYIVVNTLASIFVIGLVVREIGQELYGLVIFINLFSVGGFGGLADLGLASSIVKLLAEDVHLNTQRTSSIVAQSFTFYLILGALISCVVLLFGFNVEGFTSVGPATLSELQPISLFLSANAFLEFLILWQSAVFQGCQRFDILRFWQIAKAVLYLILASSGLAFDLDVFAWLGGMLVSNLFLVIVLHLGMLRLSPYLRPRLFFDWSTSKSLIRFSAKIFVFRITGIIYNNVAKFTLGVGMGTIAVAVYDIATRFLNLFLNISRAITPTIVPLASSLNAAGAHGRVSELFLSATYYLLVLTIPPLVITMFDLAQILNVWLGPQFIELAAPIGWVLAHLFVWSFSPIGWNILIGINRMKLIMLTNVLNVILFTASLFIFLSEGAKGVGYSLLIANAIIVPLNLWIYQKELGFKWNDMLNQLTRPLVTSILIGMSAWFVPNSFDLNAFQITGRYVAIVLLYLGLTFILSPEKEKDRILTIVGVKSA